MANIKQKTVKSCCIIFCRKSQTTQKRLQVNLFTERRTHDETIAYYNRVSLQPYRATFTAANFDLVTCSVIARDARTQRVTSHISFVDNVLRSSAAEECSPVHRRERHDCKQQFVEKPAYNNQTTSRVTFDNSSLSRSAVAGCAYVACYQSAKLKLRLRKIEHENKVNNSLKIGNCCIHDYIQESFIQALKMKIQ